MITKLGNIPDNFESIKSIIEQSKPCTVTDSLPDLDFLMLHGHHSAEITNCANYTADRLTNFKYKNSKLNNCFPDWFLDQHGFDTRYKTVAVLVQPPGNFVAPHYDQYRSSGFNHLPVVRLWIALQDAKFGQVFCVGNEILSNFQAGDVYNFDNIIHSSANAGLDTRYTMVVYTVKKISTNLP